MAGQDPNRDLEGPPAVGQPHDLFAGDPDPLCGLRRQEERVVPGQLRDRFGELLQPSVVGEPPVVNRRIGTEVDFQVRARPALVP